MNLCLEFLLKNCTSKIFGGFLRWVAEIWFDKERCPTKEELYIYLKKSDVDIKILFSNESIPILKKFLKDTAWPMLWCVLPDTTPSTEPLGDSATLILPRLQLST